MMFPRILFILTLAFCIGGGGCRTYPVFKGSAIYRDSYGRKMCSLHKLPLVQVDGYRYREGIIIDPSVKYEKVYKAFPNCIPLDESLHKENGCNPKRLEFCMDCYEGLHKALR